MSALPILKYPHESLKQKAEDWIWEQDDALRTPCLLGFRMIVNNLTDSLRESDHGAALAANQVGIVYNMFAIEPSLAAREGLPTIIVNPRITWKSNEIVEEVEGCLSFPGVLIKVPRSTDINVFYDIDGKSVEVELHDFIARVFQHEIDHLQGKTFIDHLSQLRQEKIINQILIRGK